ncbi:MAG: UDP-galactopyranose mutase [Parcubacteria group bacterium GW2011_GWA2_38_13]|nr:MAG: UDP-galactopyranose mutase [Parcubacteria group bacterium GW2011_GWA2_38_13]
MDNKQKIAIIIGAGPAGLTAAYELLTRTDIKPIILEKSSFIGGLARTIDFDGNKSDIGPHRFFSKSNRITNWWFNILPLQKLRRAETVQYHHRSMKVMSEDGPDPEKNQEVMLIRQRITRIYFLRKLFDYPISLSIDTLKKLGVIKIFIIGLSYAKAIIFPIQNEKNLEQFYINRFGKELYSTFFESYTEKVWGIPCSQISAEWGAQRVKGLSIRKALIDALQKIFIKNSNLNKKNKETSLVEQFMYPKFGAGQMWEEVANIIKNKGGQILFHHAIENFISEGNTIKGAVADVGGEEKKEFIGDYFFSTMPIQELVRGIKNAPKDKLEISEGLMYRDMVLVVMMVKGLILKDSDGLPIKDNWLYIQEHDVKVGRIQICNNMSPYLVKNHENVLLSLEYFCTKNDAIWKKSDDEMIMLASDELASIGIVDKKNIIETHVVRVEKTYPAYFGSYERFGEIREYLDTFENLILIGRNGMHKYNNMDHSMLTAMVAVDNIINGIQSKENIWAVNTEEDYHEKK